MAGLTSSKPDVPETAKISPASMSVQTGELETHEGTQVGAAPTALTDIVSDEQIKALQTAGYTFKEDGNTVTATTNTNANVLNQALNAKTLSDLTKEIEAQEDDPTVGKSIISAAQMTGIKPNPESIDVQKAEGLLAGQVDQVDRRKSPTIGDYVGGFNDNIDAATRHLTPDSPELLSAMDPKTANQAEKEVMSDLNEQAVMQLAQYSDDPQISAIATAQQQAISDVPVEATVQGQLTNLMAQFADGKTPAYAAGAIRNAEAQMAARGLSASSMAGAAIMQAAMESSIPIAAQDAQVFREINLTNLNNKQQVALSNAAAGLNIGLANLNAKQQTNLANSTNAFKLQSESLSGMQQVALANAQLRAALQDRELNYEQMSAVTNATRYAEVNGINLSNEQQAIMQDSVNNMQIATSNLSYQQQRRLSEAQIDAALTGQELSNDQQRAVTNAARIAEVNNMKFTEEQQRNLNNAKIMENMTLTNLDADMKAALTNAATYAGMDMTNLNNRQQAQVQNAQNFLQMDLSNLSNEQQGETLKYQANINSLFTDAAADNARKQFNASSENQVDEFFAQLGAQVGQQNANRVAAMKQFNVDQVNSTRKFNSSLTDNRDRFNSTMTAQINQSNANWRRAINTTNTANQNEANRINALSVFQMNQQALNNVWQQYRDEASWLFSRNMTKDQQAHEITKMNLSGDIQERLYNAQVRDNASGAAGSWAYDIWAAGQAGDD